MADIVDFGTQTPQRKTYFPLDSLPQRESVSSIALGTGWRELDEIWKIYPGQFTVVTGIPGHGKSTFILNVIANLAQVHGTKSFLYVPENEFHLRDKMAGIWGRRPRFDYFCEQQCYVQTSTPEYYDSPAQDLHWVLDRAVAAIKKDGVDLLMIDPWNELEHAKPKDLMMTDYIRQCLMYMKQFCRAHGVAVIVVAHPTKAVAENGGRTPLLSDIEGSMAWYNKCDNGLIVVREFETKTSKIISAKVREDGAGRVGQCHFHVQEGTGQFTPQYGAVSL